MRLIIVVQGSVEPQLPMECIDIWLLALYKFLTIELTSKMDRIRDGISCDEFLLRLTTNGINLEKTRSALHQSSCGLNMDSQRFNHQIFSEKFIWGRTCVTSVCVVQPVSVSFETLIRYGCGHKKGATPRCTTWFGFMANAQDYGGTLNMMNTVKAIDVQCERCSLVDGCFFLDVHRRAARN